MDYAGVLIDGAVPRNTFSRCAILFDYLVTISQVGPHQHNDPSFLKKEVGYGDDAYYWTEYEDELIDLINHELPTPWVCGLGNEPGDVIVYDRTLA